MRICVSYFNEPKETAHEFHGKKHFGNMDSPETEKLVGEVIANYPIVVDIGGTYDYYEINVADYDPKMNGVVGKNLDDFCETLLTAVETALEKNGNTLRNED